MVYNHNVRSLARSLAARLESAGDEGAVRLAAVTLVPGRPQSSTRFRVEKGRPAGDERSPETPLAPVVNGPIVTTSGEVLVSGALAQATVELRIGGAAVGSKAAVNNGNLWVPFSRTLIVGGYPRFAKVNLFSVA